MKNWVIETSTRFTTTNKESATTFLHEKNYLEKKNSEGPCHTWQKYFKYNCCNFFYLTNIIDISIELFKIDHFIRHIGRGQRQTESHNSLKFILTIKILQYFATDFY